HQCVGGGSRPRRMRFRRTKISPAWNAPSRSMKTIDLEIRPIHHWTANRVRAHVFLCMLAYHVEWHLRQVLAPLLFHDTDIDVARTMRSSPVAPTEPSATAKSKRAIKRNAKGDR